MSAAERVVSIAGVLHRAQAERHQIEPLTNSHPDLTLDDAYAIQRELVEEQLRRGNRVAGKKVGFTNPSIQQALGLVEPGFGYLFDSGEIENEGQIGFDRLLQPKLEPEIAFVMRDDLQGPGLTLADVLSATDYIIPAFEIIDSRIRDWKTKGPDIIADNAAHGLFVIGEQKRVAHETDLPQVAMTLERNGEVVATGAGTAVLGNPALAVVWLANKLTEMGLELQAGEKVLTGSLCAPIVVAKGDHVKATFGNLGSVAVRFV